MKKRFLGIILLVQIMVISNIPLATMTASADCDVPSIMTLWEGNTTDGITIPTAR